MSFLGLWELPKTNFQIPPLSPLKQPSFLKISPPKITVLFLGFTKMSLSIFGLQPLTPNRISAWPYTEDFEYKSSICKLYRLQDKQSLIFELIENVYIDFWAPALNIKMNPYMAT